MYLVIACIPLFPLPACRLTSLLLPDCFLTYYHHTHLTPLPFHHCAYTVYITLPPHTIVLLPSPDITPLLCILFCLYLCFGIQRYFTITVVLNIAVYCYAITSPPALPSSTQLPQHLLHYYYTYIPIIYAYRTTTCYLLWDVVGLLHYYNTATSYIY